MHIVVCVKDLQYCKRVPSCLAHALLMAPFQLATSWEQNPTLRDWIVQELALKQMQTQARGPGMDGTKSLWVYVHRVASYDNLFIAWVVQRHCLVPSVELGVEVHLCNAPGSVKRLVYIVMHDARWLALCI